MREATGAPIACVKGDALGARVDDCVGKVVRATHRQDNETSRRRTVGRRALVVRLLRRCTIVSRRR